MKFIELHTNSESINVNVNRITYIKNVSVYNPSSRETVEKTKVFFDSENHVLVDESYEEVSKLFD